MRSFLIAVLAAVVSAGLPTRPAAQTSDDYSQLFRDFRANGLSYADKRFLQTALAFEGNYNGLLDGDWGPLSQKGLESYAQEEFGSSAEEWHMAALAFSFYEIFERDGWAIRYVDGLDMSLLYPFDAILSDPPTDNFVNWRHSRSSLAFSVGVHSQSTTQNIHDYAESTHASYDEKYVLRRSNLAVTSAIQRGGRVLYVRSNFIRGSWSTVMLSANRQDVPILNAVAASIDVGRAPPIFLSDEGRLAATVLQTLAFLEEADESQPASSSVTSESIPQDRNGGTGTGFIVAPDGFALTNAHVVNGCGTVTVDGLPAHILASSDEFDLALLKTEGWEGDEFAMFSPAPAKLNSDVTVVGYPLAGILSGLNVTRGAVSSQLGFGGDLTSMQITAPVQPGNSGGPVLASDGEVVGVVVSKLDAQVVADVTGDIPQNVNFAIRGEIAKLFLFQNGINPTLGTSDEAATPVELAERAARYTAFIECD